MSDVIVVGAGIAGLGSALALSQQGHRVTIVERDGADLPSSPDAAFEQWTRRGAPQARHSHAFLARLRNLLRDRAPEVLAELLAAGATEVRFIDHPPPRVGPLDPEPGDEDLVALACRRTTFEWVLRRHVLQTHGVKVVDGVVDGVLTSGAAAGDIPHVDGVRLTGGAEHRCDVVVDASGRRSPLPEWLVSLGAVPVEEEEEDTGIVYSSRFYRLRPGMDVPYQGGLVVADLGYLKYAVFGGDNGTFSITFGIYADDKEMRQLLSPDPFTVAASALVGTRPWVEPARAEPITGVEVMARLINRRRRFVVDGQPIATGVFPVGDSSICTNPLYGRGCSLALVQAYLLADVLAEYPDDALAAAHSYDAGTRGAIEPWFRAATDQDRTAHNGDGPDMASLVRHGLLPAARSDAVVFRAFLRSFNLLQAPGDLMSDPAVVARVLTTWQGRHHRPPGEALGPERDELLRILDAAATGARGDTA